MAQKPILIAGAGPSSLLLAQSLLRSGIPFQVFERDASLAFRGQGYRLRLSNEGLDAIESVLDPEAFQKFYQRCGKTSGGGSGFIYLDAFTGEKSEKGSVNLSLKSRDDKIVGIARGALRSVFVEGIEGRIQFNKDAKGYEMVEDGVQIVFSDGTKSDVGSLLVAGDGVKSAIATNVSKGKLKVYDTGVRGIHGQAPSAAFQGLGEGVFRITDEKGLSVVTNVRPGDKDDPNVELGWTMTGRPGVLKAPNDDYTTVGSAAASLAKALTSDWHPRIRPLFEEINEEEAAFWKVTCSNPTGVPMWPNNPRVTVIGDAAHAVTPAGGIGANTAMRDSALLGKLLRETGGFRRGLTEDYEAEMRKYASEAVKVSHEMAKKSWGIVVDDDSPTVR